MFYNNRLSFLIFTLCYARSFFGLRKANKAFWNVIILLRILVLYLT